MPNKNAKTKSASEKRRLAIQAEKTKEPEKDPEDLDQEEDEDEDEPENGPAVDDAADSEDDDIPDEPEDAPAKRGKFNPVGAPLKQVIASLEGPGIKIDKIAAGSKAETMARALAAQPKIRTIIRLEGKEKRGAAVETAILNGCRFNILKGVFVSLPEQVAELFENAQNETMAALEGSNVKNQQGGLGIRLDRDEEAQEKLTK